jgi:hypothetical protein
VPLQSVTVWVAVAVAELPTFNTAFNTALFTETTRNDLKRQKAHH